MDQEVGKGEVRKAWIRMKKIKAVDPDHISIETWKRLRVSF